MKKNFLFIIFLFLFFTGFSQTKKTYVYSIIGKDTLKLDVYTPDNLTASDSLPVLIWIHGGSFISGNRDNSSEKKLAEIVTQKGFIGVSISYRLTRKGESTGFGCECTKEEKISTFKNAIIDYLDASLYIYKNSKAFNVDRTKMIAGGSSAGAEVVLNAVYLKDYFLKDSPKYNELKFAGILSLSGAVLTADYINENNAIPTMLFHGTNDRLVPYYSASHHKCDFSKPGYLKLDGSYVIAKKLKELDSSYYLYAVKGGKHEISSIPFEKINIILDFFNQASFNKKKVQTKKVVKKQA